MSLLQKTAPKGSQPPPPAPDAVLLVTGHLVEQLPVTDLTAELIGTAAGEFPREPATELIRRTGGRLFIINASLPARVEADQVRTLRKNALLASLFRAQPQTNGGEPSLFLKLVIGGLVLGLVLVGAFHH
jgi:hypothetical protein